MRTVHAMKRDGGVQSMVDKYEGEVDRRREAATRKKGGEGGEDIERVSRTACEEGSRRHEHEIGREGTVELTISRTSTCSNQAEIPGAYDQMLDEEIRVVGGRRKSIIEARNAEVRRKGDGGAMGTPDVGQRERMEEIEGMKRYREGDGVGSEKRHTALRPYSPRSMNPVRIATRTRTAGAEVCGVLRTEALLDVDRAYSRMASKSCSRWARSVAVRAVTWRITSSWSGVRVDIGGGLVYPPAPELERPKDAGTGAVRCCAADVDAAGVTGTEAGAGTPAARRTAAVAILHRHPKPAAYAPAADDAPLLYSFLCPYSAAGAGPVYATAASFAAASSRCARHRSSSLAVAFCTAVWSAWETLRGGLLLLLRTSDKLASVRNESTRGAKERGWGPAGGGGDEGRPIGEGEGCAKEGSALRWDYRRDAEQGRWTKRTGRRPPELALSLKTPLPLAR
ncbi:hypothetical protein B0H14DRAFT_2588454 [Mycena olivaceomarginata]|nr:hypothetical protein B0H14DRAFT_2588454 [Mycena olivaceomarginata]